MIYFIVNVPLCSDSYSRIFNINFIFSDFIANLVREKDFHRIIFLKNENNLTKEIPNALKHLISLIKGTEAIRSCDVIEEP